MKYYVIWKAFSFNDVDSVVASSEEEAIQKVKGRIKELLQGHENYNESYSIMDKRLAWFKENSKYLNFDAIEKELKIPQSTLYKWTSGQRELPKKWQPVLIKWVDMFVKIF